MSTSNGNTSNPSLDAGRPETSGLGETRDRQQEQVGFAESRMIELLGVVGLCLMAARHCPGADFGDSAIGASGEFFRSDDGAVRLDRLDWQSIVSALEAPLGRFFADIGDVGTADVEADDWAYGWLLSCIDLCEGLRAWLRSTRFRHTLLDHAEHRAVLQILEMFAKQIDAIVGATPVRKVLN